MNVTQLRAVIDDALARGLHPETTVVIARDGWYSLVDLVEHPCDGREEGEGVELWFTITPSEQDADPRFTPGHHPVPDPILHGEYEQQRDNEILPQDSSRHGEPIYYEDWLRHERENLVSLIQDVSSRDHETLADLHGAVVRIDAEMERLG